MSKTAITDLRVSLKRRIVLRAAYQLLRKSSEISVEFKNKLKDYIDAYQRDPTIASHFLCFLKESSSTNNARITRLMNALEAEIQLLSNECRDDLKPSFKKQILNVLMVSGEFLGYCCHF